jgi:hypothetical protein
MNIGISEIVKEVERNFLMKIKLWKFNHENCLMYINHGNKAVKGNCFHGLWKLKYEAFKYEHQLAEPYYHTESKFQWKFDMGRNQRANIF